MNRRKDFGEKKLFWTDQGEKRKRKSESLEGNLAKIWGVMEIQRNKKVLEKRDGRNSHGRKIGK